MQFSRRWIIARALAGTLGWAAWPNATFAQAMADSEPRPPNFFDVRTRAAADRGLDFLAARQNEDGTFGGGPYSRNLAVCGLAGMAFLAAGHQPGRGKFGPHLNRCVDYILEHVSESGFIRIEELDTRGPMYGHGFATLFLAEVYGAALRSELREKLTLAVQLLIHTQNDEGGWRYEPRRDEADVSVTVCQVMALRAAHNAGLHVPKETIDKAVDYVKRCQNSDGGFMYMASTPGESSFPRSAAAVVALYRAGIHEGQQLERGLKYLMQFPPSGELIADRSYYLYGQYYAVQAMWHAGGKYWDAWYPAIRDVLLEQQRREDGAWPDSIGPEYGTAMACLILRMPENYLPIFER